MASITIRNIEDRLKTRLKARAAEHGCSMEEEARHILRQSLDRQRPQTAADIARELFGPKHGFELPAHPPVEPPPPPDFGDK
jgi:plasmid stability protein